MADEAGEKVEVDEAGGGERVAAHAQQQQQLPPPGKGGGGTGQKGLLNTLLNTRLSRLTLLRQSQNCGHRITWEM